ncbi:MAG: SRPBCC family protein [Caulobacterales bacterium]
MARASIGKVVEHLLDYVENDRTFSTDKVVKVPAANYLDESRWRREMDSIFLRLPLVLAASCELPEPGAYKAMEAIGKPLLITRDKTGKARVFFNVCRHRGATIANEGHGECARFSCPYHGWTYASDGRLIGVADPAKFGDVDKAALGLRELPSAEKAGLIFAVLTPDASIDVDSFYGGMLDDFEDLDFKNYTFLGRRVIHGANWKVAYDGYLEGYHFAVLHPHTIHPRTPSNVTHYEAFGPHLRIGFPQNSLVETLRAAPREQWERMENSGFDFVRILFPNVSAFMAPEITQIAQLFPGPTPDKNITVLNFYRKEPPRDDADHAGLEGMMNWLRDVVRDEDYMMGERIQKGLESGAIDSVVLGKNERGNQFFHEYVDWYLAGDPKAPKPEL